MTRNIFLATTAICSSLAFAFGSVAVAADIETPLSRAVSAPNGKIEISGGDAGLNGFNSSMLFRGGASFSAPVGDMFGIQADLAAANIFNDTIYGGTLHAFTRDPNSYLFGVAGGAGWSSVANFQYVGPEAELYLDNVTVQAYGGYINVNNAGINRSDLFAFGDLSFYATPDLAFKIGASSVAGFKSARAGIEWQFSDSTPVSFTLEGRLGDNGFAEATAGLKLYFGGAEKSLIRRHREDDPPNRSLDIFNASGNTFGSTGSTPPGCVLPEVDVGGGECDIPPPPPSPSLG